MKRKFWKWAAICIGCFVLVMGCTGCVQNAQSDAKNEKAPASMTLMIYMVGSDLEAATAAATNDMKEIEKSGVDLTKVKLLIYTGGSPKWHNDALEVPTDVNAVFELTENGYTQVTDFEVLSMGEAESLTRFLQYGYDNYKSESYSLILWDHGNGPVMGYGSDLQYGKDALTLPEIQTALMESPFGSEEKLSFIGFDACLMASAELACMVDEFADYMIASQETEPGFGWNYQFLEQCCKVNTYTLIQTIVDQYISYCEAYFEQNEFFKSEVTLAAVDLSYAAELETSVDQLFGAAADDVSGSFNQLAIDRVETRAFGRATTGSEYDLVDMQALMNSMNESYKDETNDVQDILEQMVIHSGSNTVESCGLSLYYPYYNKKYYEASWKDSYEALGLFPNYISYLERYGQIWLGTDMKEYFSGELVAREDSSGTYTLQLSEEQKQYYADSGFYILRRMGEDAYSVIYSSPDVDEKNGLLTAKFDGKVIYYGNDLGDQRIPVTRVLDEVDGEARYGLYPVLTGSVDEFLTSDSLNCRMVISVDPGSGEVKVLDFSPSSDEEIQTGKRPQVDLDEWVRIQFYEIKSRYLTRDEDGRILNYWEWPEADWILWNETALADGLNFSYETLYDDGGEYFLMFNIMDVQGNQYCSELYPIVSEEQPPQEEVTPTDAGVLEECSALIFDRDGVKLYLEIIKDEGAAKSVCCFRAVNSNDFSVRIHINELLVNGGISCSDYSVYLTADAGANGYGFVNGIEAACMMEQMDLPKQLDFCVNMYNEVNDKTLINDETFKIEIADTAYAKLSFLEVLGAAADAQILEDNADGVKATLLGAGYLLNKSNYQPNGEYAKLTGMIVLENISDTAKEITIGGVSVNDSLIIAQDSSYFSQIIALQPGEKYYYMWDNYISEITEAGIDEIRSLKQHLSIDGSEHILDIQLEDTNQ